MTNRPSFEASNELYDLTYDIIRKITKDDISLVLHIGDRCRGNYEPMSEEPACIRITMQFGEKIHLSDIPRYNSDAWSYGVLIRHILDYEMENEMHVALLYLMILLHELGHHKDARHLAKYNINIMDIKSEKEEIVADLFMSAHLREVYTEFFERARVIFENMNK